LLKKTDHRTKFLANRSQRAALSSLLPPCDEKQAERTSTMTGLGGRPHHG